MANLLVVPPAGSGAAPAPRRRARRWPWTLGPAALVVAVFAFWIWATNAEKREIQSLPDPQRRALFHRLLDDLRESCDPAPPRSLRDFCHRQAALALKFRECDTDPRCQELARRHLVQPHR